MLGHQSWGNYPRVAEQHVEKVRWRPRTLALNADQTCVLPYGLGRSQGDVCLNEAGWLLDTSALNHFIAFDGQRGIIRCEAGVTLAEILTLTVPQGWILPVIPGTKFVTVAGAVANDVHGKNHVQAGTFGCHVTQFELLRSDGTVQRCSSQEHPELFAATIGGLGLTGLITWVELQLKPIVSPYLTVTTQTFKNLNEFFEITESSTTAHYLVGQLDTVLGRSFGRGVVMRADHEARSAPDIPKTARALTIPFNAPGWLLNDYDMKLFNSLYQWRAQHTPHRREYYESYFFPLDRVQYWNRLYGARGFIQYQCVVPKAKAPTVFAAIFAAMKQAKRSAYLTSLKVFGDIVSPGMLSFPRPGYVIALDIPVGKLAAFTFLEKCDELVREAHGAVYPAKDARMSSHSFQTYFPQWQEFAQHIDPAFSSSFWRRVTNAADVKKN